MGPHATLVLVLAAPAITVVSAALGWLRWLRPWWRRTRAEVVGVRDSILGRDAVRDSITGRELAPALPGVGVRLESSERQLAIIGDAVAKIADTHARIENHEDRLTALEKAAIERIVTRAESASAWSAVDAALRHDKPTDGDEETPVVP